VALGRAVGVVGGNFLEWGKVLIVTAGGYPNGWIRGYPGSLEKVNLVQGYQVMKEAVICARENQLSVWVVAGKMTPSRLYSKGMVVVYRAAGEGMILAFLAVVYMFALTRKYLKEIIAICPSMY